MITRKTLRQVNAQKGHFDAEKFESLTDADIDRMIAEDPELAPPTHRWPRYWKCGTSGGSSGLRRRSSPKPATPRAVDAPTRTFGGLDDIFQLERARVCAAGAAPVRMTGKSWSGKRRLCVPG
jgi:hypothetical protein